MKIESIKKLNIPDKPGVYLFKKNGHILYIGKATSLRNRVRSYMSKGLFDMRGPLVEKMAAEADEIDWIVTDSVLEALILEANLIKKYQPKYNTDAKDDKSWNYVCITQEKLPKVLIVRGYNVLPSLLNKMYGPYTNGSQLKEALKIIRKIFPYLDDKSKTSYEFYRQVNLVPSISNKEGIEKYKKDIRNLKLFFSGKKKKILQNLKREMKVEAKAGNFELAAKIRNQIFALDHINDIALLKDLPYSPPLLEKERGDPNYRIEAYDIAHMGGKNMVGVMVVVENGEIKKREYKKFKIRTQNNINDTGALAEILERRLAHKEWAYPSLIVVDGGIAQLNVVKKVLKKLNLNIGTVALIKDERHKPKSIIGDEKLIKQHKSAILLANSEAHRFAISYHKNLRGRNFLK
ncbi:hypothetical protein A3D42_01750 [Candidatus Nomurabacteria bacterium RIFCSPHIGHO2_02_FULL_41_18]|uniref:Excinuclease ABC subunit C n=1 Tax=Candidatus Nomurabacteria bacterium RIFCSPHIGHO2_02_FULL_41_18 TaxID=1801754 RepID=A0A1F6W824_9BACT|nr:MAG: hypothetical protein A2737_01695 [Candidatus Nomurabacteria bacterium RIFCSPHIGHO2_01_FULL_41_71]OGI77984.1 MAG: hypothetical protein A3D42_01750 [Candidatus Nomurabacteria bacterium RIFCSPHIGHO2_02_FULL_41_18]OGI90263.1 MAG: hypothetical protein A3B01_03075 [Candidatus Nomurabacteria bacterium RIFCSPLOWO2_01_FULL_41_52b]